MSLLTFDMLPDHARLWVFASGVELSPEQRRGIEDGVGGFLSGWAAHGAALTAGFTILHDRFLLVGVNQDETAPSGCSIDAMTRFLRGLEAQVGVDFLDAPDCWYRIGNEIQSASRGEFRQLAKNEEVDAETTVFDLTVPTIGDLRNGAFETAAGLTWYAKAFPLGAGVTQA